MTAGACLQHNCGMAVRLNGTSPGSGAGASYLWTSCQVGSITATGSRLLINYALPHCLMAVLMHRCLSWPLMACLLLVCLLACSRHTPSDDCGLLSTCRTSHLLPV